MAMFTERSNVSEVTLPFFKENKLNIRSAVIFKPRPFAEEIFWRLLLKTA